MVTVGGGFGYNGVRWREEYIGKGERGRERVRQMWATGATLKED